MAYPLSSIPRLLVSAHLLACAGILALPAQAQQTDMQVTRLVTLSDRNVTDATPTDEKWALDSIALLRHDPPVLVDNATYGSYLYWAGRGTRFDPNDLQLDWSSLPSNSRTRMGPAFLRVPPAPAKYQKSVITKEIFGTLTSEAILGTQVIERADGTLVAGLIHQNRSSVAKWTQNNMYPLPDREYPPDRYGSTLLKTGALVRTDGDGANARLIFSTLNKVYFPYGRMAQAADGTLYGMDEGPDGHGRIYRLSASDTLSDVHTFAAPLAGTGQWLNDIILGSDGWLYGLLAYGRGTPGAAKTRTSADTPTGVLFKVHPDQPGSYAILREFTLQDGEFNVESPDIQATANGSNYYFYLTATGMNTLAEGPDGRIYGTSSINACNVLTTYRRWLLRPATNTDEQVTITALGPSLLCGAVRGSVSLTTTGSRFPKWEYLNDSNLYDVDFNRNGTIFRMERDGSGFQTLHRFDGTNGATPRGPIAFLGNTLVGTTLSGGEPHYYYDDDPVHEGWTRNNLPADRTEDDLAHKASDGILYGLDINAWETNAGNAFRVLHAFSERTTGRTPVGVTQGKDGALYGMARSGGAEDWFANVQGTTVQYAYSNSGTIWRYGVDQGASITLNVFPASIQRGETARLSWTASGVVPASCTATSRSNDWQGPQSEDGATELVKTESGVYNYSLSCVNAANGMQVSSNTAILRVDSDPSETDGNSIRYTGGGGGGAWYLLALLPAALIWRQRRLALTRAA